MGRARARPRVADGSAPGAGPRDRLGAAPPRSTGPRCGCRGWSSARGCPRSSSCSTSSGCRCCPTSAGSCTGRGWRWCSTPTGSAPAARSSRRTTRSPGRAQFRQGFKLFYHWDIHRFTPHEVRRIRPRGELRQLPVTGAGAAPAGRTPASRRTPRRRARRSPTQTPPRGPSRAAGGRGTGRGTSRSAPPWTRITTSQASGHTAARRLRRPVDPRAGAEDEPARRPRGSGPTRCSSLSATRSAPCRSSSGRSRNQCTSPVTVIPLIAAVRTHPPARAVVRRVARQRGGRDQDQDVALRP